MSDYIDPRVVEAACMADLSRARQEELPLSSVAKRGPSFDPRGRNGTSHYSAKLKQDLNNRWNVTIDDEESRQIEGLHLDNARPWGKEMAKQIMESDPVARQVVSCQSRVQKMMVTSTPPPIPTTWGPPKISATLNPVLPSPVLATVSKPSSEAHPARKDLTHLRLELAQKPETVDSTELVICTGRCEVVPEKQELCSFEVEFEMVLFHKTAKAFLHLEAVGRGKRVHGILDFEAPVMDGPYCKLTHRPDSSDYFLRLADNEETGKFKKCVQALQQSMTVHLQAHPAEANLENTQPVRTSEPDIADSQSGKVSTPVTQHTPDKISPSAIEDLTPVSPESKESGSVSGATQDTLIAMDDFEEVRNSQIPCLLNATEHIVHLVETVMVHFALEDNIIDSVVQGIEDGAIEYWIQHGFMRDCEDEIKDNFIAVLRNMAQIKIKLHLRQAGREKGQGKQIQAQVERCAEAIAEQVRRIQYTPEMLESLQQLAVIPKYWKATKGLPVSTSVVGSSGVQNTEAVKNNTLGNGAVPTTPSTPSTRASGRHRPNKGLADSRWATTGAHGGVLTIHNGIPSRRVSQPRSVSSMSSDPSTGKRLPQGLSSSRYASRPVQFEGNFTGAQ
ncbi:hypothetical protein AK830_g7480 [Neonectria ditissima]|uniref:Uncharacterized protein n=1 Tax=Neonectria ditissima TaxID=78410 RepID=A0A0P7AZG4_9HYPO|nr:hypothetical protein AK830_g7480 [Neonectria ditissima]